MRIMIVGGAGFIGSNFVHYWVDNHPNDDVIVYDALSYAGRRENLQSVASAVKLVVGDIADREHLADTVGSERVECIINFAAESDNNRAVLDAYPFVRTNVVGTHTLLDVACQYDVARLHHVSTCEVFGDMGFGLEKPFSEEAPYRPNTPYAATKAAADHLVFAYNKTYQLPTTISRSANNYGPRQYPEKNPPLFIVRALRGERLPLFRQHHHQREWLSVSDHCRALEAILERGAPGESYNIGTGVEKSVLQMAEFILRALRLPVDGSVEIVPDRPGHDRRYVLDSSKLRDELGWQPHVDFESGLRETIDWYRSNEWWWSPLVSAA